MVAELWSSIIGWHFRLPRRGKFVCGYPRRFLEILFVQSTPHSLNSKEKKNGTFYHIPWNEPGLKDGDGFKGRR